jgi:hypothetical protein
MFSCTSIMTAGAMRCATPAQCARSWACNTRDNERFRHGRWHNPPTAPLFENCAAERRPDSVYLEAPLCAPCG